MKRHLAAAGALAFWCAAFHLGKAAPLSTNESSSVPSALVASLARRGIEVEPRSIHWVSESHGGLHDYLFGAPAAFIGTRRGEPSDVFTVDVELSPEGSVLGLRRLVDLTQTSLVSESHLTGAGSRLAWLVPDGNGVSIEIADLDGDPLPKNWSASSRLQTWIANYQTTGRTGGIARRSLKLSPPTDQARVSLDGREVSVDTGAYEVHWPHREESPTIGSNRSEAKLHEHAAPGNLVTWTVDRLRAMPWFGSDRMQWLKAITFAAIDRWMRLKSRVSDDEAETIAAELGELATSTASIEVVPSEIGWPPEGLKPILRPPLEREGDWVPAHPDIVSLRNPGAPYPFLFTFLRTDPERGYSQISITLWDPRQVALHIVAGTQEPKSATGETGSGLIPRDPKIIGRVVAAFNGAFQSLHGDFGMMEKDAVVLPPKPYAATVAELRSGVTGFGTWPNATEIPEEFLSFRQNMTPLVVDGEYNPYRRHWWGGLPMGWEEESRTVRSGLCTTEEGYLAYFYGNHADPAQLGRAMVAARCVYGMHLDMNAGHTGFEFYRTARSRTSLATGRLDPMWEAAEPVPSMPEWQFLTRLMVRKMPLMNFPRYLYRSSRDFFYLTMRSLLPEKRLPPIDPRHPRDGNWDVTAFAQHGWPAAAARTVLHLPLGSRESAAQLIMIDPSLVAPVARPVERSVVTIQRPRSAGTRVLWHADGKAFVGESLPPAAQAISYGDARDTVSDAVSAAGITDSGKLVFVKLVGVPAGPASIRALNRVLDLAACSSTIFFENDIGVVGGRLLENEPVEMASAPLRTRARVAVVLERTSENGVRRIFPNTPVLPPSGWAIAQRRKVPYTGRHASSQTP